MAEHKWNVSDLLDINQPLVEEAKIARQVLESIALIEQTNADVRIPQAAIEFAENALGGFLDTIAEIEKSRGNIPYLVPRNLYTLDGLNAPGWRQGLEVDGWKVWTDDYDFIADLQQQKIIKMNSKLKSNDPFSGYYNRILPVKFVLRVLAVMTMQEKHEYIPEDHWESGDSIGIDDLRKTALDCALYARSSLERLDRKTGNPKNYGAEIAVGFPEDSDKAKERFVAQFVVSKRKNNLSGAIIDMGFANVPDFAGTVLDEVLLTPAGWQFVMMPNPIIDFNGEDWLEYMRTGKKFSDQEVAFLLAHFKKNVPAEWKFMVEVAKSINGGNDRPKQVESELKKTYEWEATKISQMRNGVISRMEELQLLSRHKEGREVTYKLTKLGEDSLL